MTISPDAFRISPAVPYIRQTDENSCGAAFLGMVVGHRGREVSQQDLITMLEIDTHGYTSKEALRNALARLGMEYQEFSFEGGPDGTLQYGSLEKMLEIVDGGDPVMVNYLSAGEGHYAVVVGYTERCLIIHGPERGPERSVFRNHFERNGRSENERWEKWFLAVF